LKSLPRKDILAYLASLLARKKLFNKIGTRMSGLPESKMLDKFLALFGGGCWMLDVDEELVPMC
jgi:hypothetical protein